MRETNKTEVDFKPIASHFGDFERAGETFEATFFPLFLLLLLLHVSVLIIFPLFALTSHREKKAAEYCPTSWTSPTRNSKQIRHLPQVALYLDPPATGPCKGTALLCTAT